MDDYEDWHIPGSRNIDDYDELQDVPETARTRRSEISDDRDIITVYG